jgi:hypothetical protein
LIIARLTTLPLIIEPDFVIELATMTLISDETLAGGLELFPGVPRHVAPQVAGVVLVEFAKPLKFSGGSPRIRRFCVDHCAPQKVTCLPTTASRSPMTNFSN